MGVGGPVFNIFKDFLSNRQQRVLVDRNFSQFKPVVSVFLKAVFLARYSSFFILLIMTPKSCNSYPDAIFK